VAVAVRRTGLAPWVCSACKVSLAIIVCPKEGEGPTRKAFMRLSWVLFERERPFDGEDILGGLGRRTRGLY
jgi:hypothetical protein